MRRNLDLLSILFTMTRKNMTEKKKDCFGWEGSVVIDAI